MKNLKSMTNMENDILFLHRTIEIAWDSISKGGGPFGTVITMDGRKISEASNLVVLNHDPTAHAEILAIRLAAAVLNTHDLGGCTLFSSCEPCPMCLGAIYWAGIKKVVYASNRTDAEKAGFSDNMIYEELLLPPLERKIKFIHLTDVGEKDVFRKWIESDNKISY
jgi:guanine deaminase